MTEENRGKLLKRLGGLNLTNDGELEAAKRAVIEVPRSNIPWSKELEERITRFAIAEICNSIIPSGDVQGWASLQVISNPEVVGSNHRSRVPRC